MTGASRPSHGDWDTVLETRQVYEAELAAGRLREAGLDARVIDAARKGQWKRLPEMLAELAKKDNDEVYRQQVAKLERLRALMGSQVPDGDLDVDNILGPQSRD